MTLARAQRAVLIGAILAASAAAWIWLIGSPHAAHQGFAGSLVMWQIMTVAMMLPASLHWLLAYAELVHRQDARRMFRAVVTFVAGYLIAWLGYSVAGALIQTTLQRSGLLDGEGRVPAVAGGIVLIGAGLFYLAPFRRACLRHCRNPLTWFIERWNNGPRGGFRFGLVHGFYCIGCCWALMLTGLAVGVMNLFWMGFLTVLVCVENLSRRGDRVARVGAGLLVLGGIAVMLRQ